jgi:hypothetical protein
MGAVGGLRRAAVPAGREAVRLTSARRLAWTPATGALLEPAGLAGVTLEQAADGALRGQMAA